MSCEFKAMFSPSRNLIPKGGVVFLVGARDDAKDGGMSCLLNPLIHTLEIIETGIAPRGCDVIDRDDEFTLSESVSDGSVHPLNERNRLVIVVIDELHQTCEKSMTGFPAVEHEYRGNPDVFFRRGLGRDVLCADVVVKDERRCRA